MQVAQPGGTPRSGQAMNQRQLTAVELHRENACNAAIYSTALGCAAILGGVLGHAYDSDMLKVASTVPGGASLAVGAFAAQEIFKVNRMARQPHGPR